MEKILQWRHRYTALSIVFCIWTLSYLDRMVMSTAIPYIAQEFGLSDTQKGMVMSAFFLGYFLCQIPGGILSDRFGARKVLVFAIIWWSTFTALTGLASGFAALIGIRILFGVGEGIAPAATWRALANWTPPKKRGLYNGIMMSTNSLGPALAPLFVVAVLQSWGWHTVFYFLFIPGLLIGLWAWIKMPDNPADKKGISQEELNELHDVGDSVENTPQAHLTFWEVLRVPSVWKSFLILFFTNTTAWGFLTWIPTYLVEARGFSMTKMGVAASLPFFAGTVGAILAGITVTSIFKGRGNIQLIITQVGTALFLYLTYTATSINSLMVYNTITGFFVFYGVITVFNLPMSTVPKEISGRAMGIVNTAGQLAGLLAPTIVGMLITTVDGAKNYNSAFGFLCMAAIIGAFIGCFYSTDKKIV